MATDTKKFPWRSRQRDGSLGEPFEAEMNADEFEKMRVWWKAIEAMPDPQEKSAAIADHHFVMDLFACFPGTTSADASLPTEVFNPHIGKFGKESPVTARKAAINVYPRSGTQRHVLLSLIRSSGEKGLTCDEAEVMTGLPHQSASARWNELWHGLEGPAENGEPWLIVPNGRERTTRAGGAAMVFVVTALAHQLMAGENDGAGQRS